MRRRMIVADGEVQDPLAEIAYNEAVKIEPDFEVGEDLYQEVDIMDFGRRAILAAKQTLASRISDLKKNVLVKKYNDRVGEIVNAEVCIRFGRKKFFCWMKRAASLFCRKASKSPKITLRRERAYALW